MIGRNRGCERNGTERRVRWVMRNEMRKRWKEERKNVEMRAKEWEPQSNAEQQKKSTVWLVDWQRKGCGLAWVWLGLAWKRKEFELCGRCVPLSLSTHTHPLRCPGTTPPPTSSKYTLTERTYRTMSTFLLLAHSEPSWLYYYEKGSIDKLLSRFSCFVIESVHKCTL